MVGRFHGTPYLRAERGLGTRRVQNCNLAGELDAAGMALEDTLGQSARRLDLARFRQRRRAYIEAAGAVPAATPMWIGRAGWLADAQRWVLGDGAAVLRGRLAPEKFLTLCRAAARYADSATGRHMAATAKTLARDSGYSVRTVGTWRKLLAESGLGVLARQGCGGGGRPNRAPVWHLISRPEQGTCHLPPSRRDRRLSPVKNYSPSAQARTKPSSTPPKTSPPQRRWAPQRPPRPLALQRLAATLVAQCQGLHPGHIGSVCDAIRGAGIDATAVTAAQIRGALDADMRETGCRWPDQITRPGAFLRYRLNRVSARLDALTQASTGGGCAAAGGLEEGTGQRPADPAVRAAAMAAIPAVGPRTRPTSASDERDATETARCDLCDDNGMRGMHLCDHIDHAAAAKRGMDTIRRAMGWDQRTRPVLQSRNTARTETVVSEHVCEICGTTVEQRPSERHAPLCAACSAVMDRDAMEVADVPVIA